MSQDPEGSEFRSKVEVLLEGEATTKRERMMQLLASNLDFIEEKIGTAIDSLPPLLVTVAGKALGFDPRKDAVKIPFGWVAKMSDLEFGELAETLTAIAEDLKHYPVTKEDKPSDA